MKLLLASLFFAACGGFMAWLYLPSIQADLALDETALEVATDARIDKASCRVRLAILSSCDVDYTRAGESGEFEYMILKDLGGAPVTLLRDPAVPGSLTSNIGIENTSTAAS